MLHWIFGSLVRILNTHVCQDMKGNVRVFCRFRPLTKREEDLGDIPVLHKVDWQCWTGLWICHIIVVMLHGKNTRSVWFLACLHPRKLIVMLPKAQVSNHLDECLCSCGWREASISIGIGVSPALKLTHFIEKPVSRCSFLKGEPFARERNCSLNPASVSYYYVTLWHILFPVLKWNIARLEVGWFETSEIHNGIYPTFRSQPPRPMLSVLICID